MGSVNIKKAPVYLRNTACSGAERRLIECCHDKFLFNITYTQCRNKVVVRVPCNSCKMNVHSTLNLSFFFTVNHTCQNGEVLLNNATNALYICIKEQWRTLCSNLIGSTQAHVACRQLNPGKTIISKYNSYGYHKVHSNLTLDATATTIVSSGTTNIFKSHFLCTGREKNLSDCEISAAGSGILCSANKMAGVICETGKQGTD